MPVGAIIGGVGAVAGAGAQMYGASKAADAQNKSTQAAIQAQQAQQAQNRADLLPFMNAGYDATNKLTGQLDALTKPFSMTQEALEATPGYQFNLSQGLKATQNSAAARGLGLSGAAMKGAASYATGLADSTYQSQFNMDQANKTNAYNKLLGVSQLGSNAASGNASYGTQTAQSIGNNLIGAGDAQAAAYMKMGTAAASGFNGVNQALYQNNLMQGMYGNGGGWVPAGSFSGYGFY